MVSIEQLQREFVTEHGHKVRQLQIRLVVRVWEGIGRGRPQDARVRVWGLVQEGTSRGCFLWVAGFGAELIRLAIEAGTRWKCLTDRTQPTGQLPRRSNPLAPA